MDIGTYLKFSPPKIFHRYAIDEISMISNSICFHKTSLWFCRSPRAIPTNLSAWDKLFFDDLFFLLFVNYFLSLNLSKLKFIKNFFLSVWFCGASPSGTWGRMVPTTALLKTQTVIYKWWKVIPTLKIIIIIRLTLYM